MMQDKLMLLIIKVFSSFKFTFPCFIWNCINWVKSLQRKTNSENLSNFKINGEDGNGDSNYLHLFYCRYVKCHICCGFTCHCYFFRNMSWVSFYHSIEWSKIDFNFNVISKAIFHFIDSDIPMKIQILILR